MKKQKKLELRHAVGIDYNVESNNGELLKVVLVGDDRVYFDTYFDTGTMPEFTFEQLDELVRLIKEHNKQKSSKKPVKKVSEVETLTSALMEVIEPLVERIEKLEAVTKHADMHKQVAEKFKKHHGYHGWEVGDEFPLDDQRLTPAEKKANETIKKVLKST